jgi:hypothetical protein
VGDEQRHRRARSAALTGIATAPNERKVDAGRGPHSAVANEDAVGFGSGAETSEISGQNPI